MGNEAATSKLRLRQTNRAGANRMLLDNKWHSSRPLEGWNPGDVLRVKSKETGEVLEWEIVSESFELAPEEAKAEWRKYPFGSLRFAESHSYFPYVVELRRLAEVPPVQYSPRYI